jgi:hypothetical protein
MPRIGPTDPHVPACRVPSAPRSCEFQRGFAAGAKAAKASKRVLALPDGHRPEAALGTASRKATRRGDVNLLVHRFAVVRRDPPRAARGPARPSKCCGTGGLRSAPTRQRRTGRATAARPGMCAAAPPATMSSACPWSERSRKRSGAGIGARPSRTGRTRPRHLPRHSVDLSASQANRMDPRCTKPGRRA